MTSFFTTIKLLPCTSYITASLWKSFGIISRTACPLKLGLSRGKRRQLGPGDITSCVFESSVVRVIWFRWKRSVWITVGYGFPVLSLRYFATQSTLLLTQASCGSGFHA